MDPEWINNGKERDRKIKKLTNGPIPPSRKSTQVRSMEQYSREKEHNNNENDGPRQSAIFQPNFAPPDFAPPVASRIWNTPPIPSPCNGFEFQCIEAMRSLARPATKLRPLVTLFLTKYLKTLAVLSIWTRMASQCVAQLLASRRSTSKEPRVCPTRTRKNFDATERMKRQENNRTR